MDWSGTAGAGKSVCIHTLAYALYQLARQRGLRNPERFCMTFAPTGTAAKKAGGKTQHGGFGLPMHGFDKVAAIGSVKLDLLQQDFADTQVAIFDEKSMSGMGQIGAIDERVDMLFPADLRRCRLPADPYGDGRFDNVPLPAGYISQPHGLRKFALHLLVGDLKQLTPVKDAFWWARAGRARRGRKNQTPGESKIVWNL